MGFFTRFSRGELPLSRVEAFSDGVFAIVVTLLVLELKVPELYDAAAAGELADRLLALAPKFVSWMISFIIICKFWLNHHHILSLAHHADYALVWLNALFLMFQSFVPFPTALLGQYPLNPLAVTLFGVVMAFNTLLFMLLHSHILRRVVKPELAGREDPRMVPKGLVGVVSYLIGATLAWFSPPAAFGVYLLTPLFFIVPPSPLPAERMRS